MNCVVAQFLCVPTCDLARRFMCEQVGESGDDTPVTRRSNAALAVGPVGRRLWTLAVKRRLRCSPPFTDLVGPVKVVNAAGGEGDSLCHGGWAKSTTQQSFESLFVFAFQILK